VHTRAALTWRCVDLRAWREHWAAWVSHVKTIVYQCTGRYDTLGLDMSSNRQVTDVLSWRMRPPDRAWR
jgi:hypothetical protein